MQVDGGTEGMAGHVNVIVPGVTPCFECILPIFPPQVNFPICTLADIPRTPAHCVEWAKQLEWDRVKPFGDDVELDCDEPKHMNWLYENTLKRAQQHGIEGVTYKFTQGVAKHIIPAVASTNAIVAAACANEVLKLATHVCTYMQASTGGHYTMYQGSDGVFTSTMCHEIQKGCTVCQRQSLALTIEPSITFAQLIELLKTDPRLLLKDPAISVPADTASGMRTIYNPHIASIKASTLANLDLPVSSVLHTEGLEMTVDDPALASQKQIAIFFKKSASMEE